MPQPEVQRKLAAILAADVAGYSRLVGADEEGTLARIRALRRELIDPAIAAHRGRIVKLMGDGILIEFASVVDAVRCAIAVQRGMARRNTEVSVDKRILFRVGINLGDVVAEGDDLLGDGVNVAARLEGIAEPGGICLSRTAYDHARGKIDLAVKDLGEQRLKNIAESVQVYSVNVNGNVSVRFGDGAQGVVPSTSSSNVSAIYRYGAGIAGVVAVFLAIVVGALWFTTRSGPSPQTQQMPRLSMVVLPFANLSGDPSQDYFADVLTDELTTDLARIPGSFVIARNTAFTYKGNPVDAKAIGKDLGVRYVLEGSVQPTGNLVRLNAQLIDADSGAHLWADQFDAARADLLQMQDEIVTHLARALEIQLTSVEAARLKRTPMANAGADDLAVRCQATTRNAGWEGKDAEASYHFCEQALDADPNNVRALTWLSAKFWYAVFSGSSAKREVDLKRADELASHALAIDPNYAYAHVFMAYVLETEGRSPDEAIAEAERALALDPTVVDAYVALGNAHLFLTGQSEKSIEFYDKAIRLSPRDPGLYHWFSGKSFAYFTLTQDDQAIEAARRSLAINPNYPPPYATLAAALAMSGHEAEARDVMQRHQALNTPVKSITALKARSNFHPIPSADARVRAHFDRYIEGLRKAGMPEE